MTNAKAQSPLFQALMDHQVTAKVVDLDHYRIGGGLAVETDYIIAVQPKDGGKDDGFLLSKTYSAFRTFAQQLKKTADSYKKSSLPPAATKVVKCCDLVSHLIESQKTTYVGKVNYTYVKMLAKQRSQILDDVLETTLSYFPKEVDSHPLLMEVARTIETFFLTDHIEQEEDNESGEKSERSPVTKNKKYVRKEGDNPLNWLKFPGERNVADAPIKKKNRNRLSVVVPYTRRTRRPSQARALDDQELNQVGQDAQLMLDDDRPQKEFLPSYSRPVSVVRSQSSLGVLIENNIAIFMGIMGIVIYFLQRASAQTVTADADIMLLGIFAAFCLGLHTPRPMVGGFDRPATMKGVLRQKDVSGRKLLRRSIITTTPRAHNNTISTQNKPMDDSNVVVEEMIHEEFVDEEIEGLVTMGSPMAMFPQGDAFGSHNNCWSIPDNAAFSVRGPNYLSDKKKIPSGPFLFPCRGVDLFLTDTCPENVGSNSGCFGGNLRDAPTFIINFRLPWGVLLFYFEISERFVPFLRACYEPDFDESKLPSLDAMTPSERAVCRYLLGDDEHKNSTIKIVPYIVDGPWVTKQVITGKPALIGKKLPVSYVYQAPEGDKALYLEADLDIAASSAARYILSVARTYCQVLTIDLGFVVQGNSEDELPEQMMVGARLHGIDPLTAPSLPPMASVFEMDVSEDNESV